MTQVVSMKTALRDQPDASAPDELVPETVALTFDDFVRKCKSQSQVPGANMAGAEPRDDDDDNGDDDGDAHRPPEDDNASDPRGILCWSN